MHDEGQDARDEGRETMLSRVLARSRERLHQAVAERDRLRDFAKKRELVIHALKAEGSAVEQALMPQLASAREQLQAYAAR